MPTSKIRFSGPNCCFSTIYVTITTFIAGFIGMALSYGLSLNMSLVFSIQNQCTLANYIISVERLNQYMYIPSEAPEVIEGSRPPTNWPSVGKVEIHDLQVNIYFL
jgi:ATP-binding cassette subfamily C (CFTR/MRP) protein 2